MLTVIMRDRIHQYTFSFVHGDKPYTVKFFQSHSKEEVHWEVDNQNAPILWGTPGYPPRLYRDILAAEVYNDIHRHDNVPQRKAPGGIEQLVNLSHKNLCLLLFARDTDNFRVRFFIEFKRNPRFMFWTSNPSNNLCEIGSTVELDPETLATIKMTAIAEIENKTQRLHEKSERAASSGLGDQIQAVMAEAGSA